MTIELLHTDCMDYMRELKADTFDFVVTSPPYDNLRDYGGHGEFTREVWEGVISQLFRVVKVGGVVCWIVNDQTVNGSETGTSFRQALYAMEVGFRLQDTIIWSKGACRFPDTTRYYDSFEYIFVWSKEAPQYFHPITDRRNKWGGTKFHGTDRGKDGSKNPSSGHNKRDIPDIGRRFNVWDIPNVGEAGKLHPATFPVNLAYDCIISWCPPDGMVFDPFLGSGSSAIAAYIGGFDFVGTEIDKAYYEDAVKRVDLETAQQAMF